jgi:hypothetical protein
MLRRGVQKGAARWLRALRCDRLSCVVQGEKGLRLGLAGHNRPRVKDGINRPSQANSSNRNLNSSSVNTDFSSVYMAPPLLEQRVNQEVQRCSQKHGCRLGCL